MAIYHLSAKMISRSTGRSVAAAAAYRAAESITDYRQGIQHDYSRRSGVLHTEIMAPQGAPERLRDRARLWNAVEATERRKDAQLAREVTLALPWELTEAQRLALVRAFVQEAFVAQGMIADVAIHSPGQEGDQRNYHAHILLSTRRIDGDTFGAKDRTWNSKQLLASWREGWAVHANDYLQKHEVNQQIDHRSLAAQREEKIALRAQAISQGDVEAARKFELDAMALDRDPLPDIGWHAWGMERRGARTAAGDVWREAIDRLVQVRELVVELRDRVAKAYSWGREEVEASHPEPTEESDQGRGSGETSPLELPLDFPDPKPPWAR